jgi:hypothetical protein
MYVWTHTQRNDASSDPQSIMTNHHHYCYLSLKLKTSFNTHNIYLFPVPQGWSRVLHTCTCSRKAVYIFCHNATTTMLPLSLIVHQSVQLARSCPDTVHNRPVSMMHHHRPARGAACAGSGVGRGREKQRRYLGVAWGGRDGE